MPGMQDPTQQSFIWHPRSSLPRYEGPPVHGTFKRPTLAELLGAQNGDKEADKTAFAVQEINVEDEEAELQKKIKQLHLAEDALQKKK